MNGTDEGTRWTCEAFLPTSTFQIQDLEVVESVAVEVNRKLELELGKVLTLTLSNCLKVREELTRGTLYNLHAQPELQMETYETKIMAYTAKIVNLTGEIRKMEKDPEAFNEAYTESIKIHIKQMEALVVELQSSVYESFVVFESISETVSLIKCC